MPTDKLKILLGTSYTKEIKTFDQHVDALRVKIGQLILHAELDGEDVVELVENYLGERIEEGTSYAMADQILDTPQMIMVLMHAYAEWHMIDVEKQLLPHNVVRAISKDGIIETPEEGHQRTKELLEETTLRYFLEHLSIAYEDL